jgi:glycosyltransferase involved in cell wall biosynthesis
MHDYYAICENHNLIGLERHYCDIPERPPQTCDPCLLQTRGFDPGSQARRLRFSRESFEKVDLVLAGSQASSDIFLKMFPHMRGKIEILEPPILPDKAPTAPNRPAPPAKSEPLHVAWLGNFTTTKGADTAIAVFELLRSRPFVFLIFGRLDDVDDRFKRALEAAANPAVIVYGSYDPGALPPQLQQCEVALFLSTWPETYCMTLSEAQALGLVPIVTDVGAQAERVSHARNGFLVPQNDPAAVVAALETLAADRSIVAAMRTQQPRPSGITAEDFGARLDAIYARLVNGRVLWGPGALKQTVALDELGLYLSSTRWITNPPPPPPVEEIPPPPLHIRAVNFIRNPNRLYRARLAFVRESRKIAQLISGSTKRP